MPVSAKKFTKNIWIYIIALIVVVAIVLACVLIFGGKKSHDVEVQNTETIVGLECTDRTLTHPVVKDIKPQAFKNTITANFKNGALSTITYRYEGTYKDADEADRARDFSGADYNLILSRELNTEIDIFSHHFAVDGNKVYLTISADAENVSSRTASYFLLDSTATFPKTLDAMKKAYQTKNFSCKTAN